MRDGGNKVNSLTDQLVQTLRALYTEKDEAGVIEIDPAYLAAEALSTIDPSRCSPVLVSHAAMLSLKQLARSICGQSQRDQKKSIESGQEELFSSQLQNRYPCNRNGRDVYVIREYMTRDEYEVNIARLTNEAVAKQRHSDALRAEMEKRDARGDFDSAA